MATHQFEVNARSPAPPEAVFAVLADIPRWHEWGGPVVRESVREKDGNGEPDGVGAVRKLGGWPVYSREEIVEFDRPRHMTYVMRARWPVRGYRADVDLTPDPAGGTAIRWRGGFDAPAVPGTGGPIRAVYARVIARLAAGLAHEASSRAQS